MAFLLQLCLALGVVGGSAWALSWLVTMGSIKLANKRQLLAEVNHRSSHRVPTPRVGGMGIMAGMMVGFAVLAVAVLAPTALPVVFRPAPGAFDAERLIVLVVGAVLAFLIGLWDDARNMPAWAKLVGQLLLAFAPPLLGWRLQMIHLPGMTAAYELPFALGVAVTGFWILAMMNAVNFMDGINGIAGRFSQIMGLVAVVATFQFAGAEPVIVFGIAMAGACTGFLQFNHPRAQTFMGDCGSQPLGFLLALLGIAIANVPNTYPLPFMGFVIAASPFLYDTGVTLVKRLLEGRNVMAAHREHLYQRHLIATGEDHTETLFFFELHHLPLAAMGVVYIALLWSPQMVMGQSIIVGLTVLVLGHYTWRVLEAEDRNPLTSLR